MCDFTDCTYDYSLLNLFTIAKIQLLPRNEKYLTKLNIADYHIYINFASDW